MNGGRANKNVRMHLDVGRDKPCFDDESIKVVDATAEEKRDTKEDSFGGVVFFFFFFFFLTALVVVECGVQEKEKAS